MMAREPSLSFGPSTSSSGRGGDAAVLTRQAAALTRWMRAVHQVFVPVISRLAAMPLFVLAAQLCPANVEATLFALIMGISNMSWVTGNYLGVGIVAALDLYEPEFENITTLISIRTACSIIPLITVQLLCPKGTPSDTMSAMEAANNKEAHQDATDRGNNEIQMEEF